MPIKLRPNGRTYGKVMTSYPFFKMEAMDLEIYHPFPSSLDFSDSTRLAMSKSISAPNYDKIAKSRAVLILLVTLENEHPSYMNYTSGLHLIY